MAGNADGLALFREAYLDFLEGSRFSPPSMDGLTTRERRTSEAFVKSTEDARGVDPYAERPSLVSILARLRNERDRA